LRAVLSEVTNTFGERHCYFCFHDDRRPIAKKDNLEARKIFHVSPFLPIAGTYQFRFDLTSDRVAVTINLCDQGQTCLTTSLTGAIMPLSSWRLLMALGANPLLPFKVIALIHFQAIRLYFKRIRHFNKPAPPDALISR